MCWRWWWHRVVFLPQRCGPSPPLLLRTCRLSHWGPAHHRTRVLIPLRTTIVGKGGGAVERERLSSRGPHPITRATTHARLHAGQPTFSAWSFAQMLLLLFLLFLFLLLLGVIYVVVLFASWSCSACSRFCSFFFLFWFLYLILLLLFVFLILFSLFLFFFSNYCFFYFIFIIVLLFLFSIFFFLYHHYYHCFFVVDVDEIFPGVSLSVVALVFNIFPSSFSLHGRHNIQLFLLFWLLLLLE